MNRCILVIAIGIVCNTASNRCSGTVSVAVLIGIQQLTVVAIGIVCYISRRRCSRTNSNGIIVITKTVAVRILKESLTGVNGCIFVIAIGIVSNTASNRCTGTVPVAVLIGIQHLTVIAIGIVCYISRRRCSRTNSNRIIVITKTIAIRILKESLTGVNGCIVVIAIGIVCNTASNRCSGTVSVAVLIGIQQLTVVAIGIVCYISRRRCSRTNSNGIIVITKAVAVRILKESLTGVNGCIVVIAIGIVSNTASNRCTGTVPVTVLIGIQQLIVVAIGIVCYISRRRCSRTNSNGIIFITKAIAVRILKESLTGVNGCIVVIAIGIVSNTASNRCTGTVPVAVLIGIQQLTVVAISIVCYISRRRGSRTNSNGIIFITKAVAVRILKESLTGVNGCIVVIAIGIVCNTASNRCTGTVPVAVLIGIQHLTVIAVGIIYYISGRRCSRTNSNGIIVITKTVAVRIFKESLTGVNGCILVIAIGIVCNAASNRCTGTVPVAVLIGIQQLTIIAVGIIYYISGRRCSRTNSNGIIFITKAIAVRIFKESLTGVNGCIVVIAIGIVCNAASNRCTGTVPVAVLIGIQQLTIIAVGIIYYISRRRCSRTNSNGIIVITKTVAVPIGIESALITYCLDHPKIVIAAAILRFVTTLI